MHSVSETWGTISEQVQGDRRSEVLVGHERLSFKINIAGMLLNCYNLNCQCYNTLKFIYVDGHCKVRSSTDSGCPAYLQVNRVPLVRSGYLRFFSAIVVLSLACAVVRQWCGVGER